MTLVAFAMTVDGGTSARAQQILRDWAGVTGPDSQDDLFGQSVAAIGDVDGDGVSDTVVSALLEESTPGVEVGATYVISGASGTVLQHKNGNFNRQLFGWTVCVPGDLDGDGFADYLVGAPDWYHLQNSGRVFAFSGSTGSKLFTLKGPFFGSDFGVCIGELGDVDADGVADFCVGSQWTGPGEVDVYSGKTLASLYSYTGANSDSYMYVGRGMGDLDLDGHADFAICGLFDGPNNEGIVTIYSGATGSVLYSMQGEGYRSLFGSYVTSVGDTDGDGVSDFAISANNYSGTYSGEGRAYVYSGATGALLWQYDGQMINDAYGTLPKNGAIDLNHDGFADIVIGGCNRNLVDVYSGRNGTLLYEFHGSFEGNTNETLGAAISPIGDMNSDGIDDLLVGAPNNSRYYNSAGRAYVFAGNDLFLEANKSHFFAGDAIKLANRGGEPGNATCIALTDVSGAPTFIPVAIGFLDGTGRFALNGTVPAGLAGLTMTFMGYAIGANGHTIVDSSPETIDFQ